MHMTKRTQAPHEEIAVLIRSFRIAAHWTREELAVKAGLTPMVVAAAEEGHSTQWETLTKLANAFGCDSFVELCRAGDHLFQSEWTSKLLRLWKALPDDEARKRALDIVVAEVMKPRK